MLKNFASNWSNRDTSVVVEVALIALVVLYYRYDSTTLELVRDETVHQHTIK